jgi:hypothetical protein
MATALSAAKTRAIPPHWQRVSPSGGGAQTADAGRAKSDNALLAWVSQVLAGGLAGRQPKLVSSVQGLLHKAISLLPPKDRDQFFKSIRLCKQRGHARAAAVASPVRKTAVVKKSASTKKIPAKKTLRRRK